MGGGGVGAREREDWIKEWLRLDCDLPCVKGIRVSLFTLF